MMDLMLRLAHRGKATDIVDDASLHAVEIAGRTAYVLELVQRLINVRRRAIVIVRGLPELEVMLCAR